MKTLLIVMKDQRVLLDNLYNAIAANIGDCDIRPLSDDEQKNLKKYFATHVDTAAYDRIVIFIRCKKAFAQRSFFAAIPNLVFFDHDICQNYMDCKYRGQFSRLYRTVPWARIICSGKGHTERLRNEGFDAVFVPKGYDATLLHNLQRQRPIELAFVGSTNNPIYHQRKEFLEQFAQLEPMEIVRTASGRDYLEKLNSIRYFVSADIGMGEYMIKNFEAMACGCTLLAYDQGPEENAALGFQDMVNVVLYSDIASLRHKLALLRANPALGEQIAAAGQKLAEQNFSFATLGARIAEALQSPLREKPAATGNPLWSSIRKIFQLPRQ